MLRYFLFYFLLFTSQLMAQVPLSERLIGIDQGLSNSSISAIYQDRSGFIWMGTHDGLNRYDGRDFKVYRHQFNQPNTIDGNWIVCITGDTQGRIWIGTSKGLNIYDPISDSFKHLNYDDGHTIRKLQSNIADVKADKYGNVFVATTNYGLLKCNKGALLGRRVPTVSPKSAPKFDLPISAIGLDSKGVWVTGRNVGLMGYDYKKNVLYHLNKQVTNNNTLAIDHQGQLWLGNDDGLYCYINNKLKQVYSSRNRIVSPFC